MKGKEDNVNDNEVDQKFQDIVNEETEDKESEEWFKTHGIFSFADIAIGAGNLGVLIERLQMCTSHVYRLIGNGVELNGPVGDDGVAVFLYPDEATRNKFEV